ncbi:MAG: tetratricopeptide repeat protein, partial [Nitrospiraceae bacterium]
MHHVPASSPSVASGVDPALDAQTKLLESAYRAYVQERYPLAAVLFQRFVDSNPSSPRLSEARWWLARSYEERGDLPAALSVYRSVVGAAPPSVPLAGTYAFHALNRLDVFRRSLGSTSLLERRQIALWLPNADWLTASDAGVWIAQLAGAGVTSLILEAGQSGPMGVYVQTTKVPVVADRFKAIVPVAHAKGMAVLASLNLHEPGWMAVNPEWRTVIAGGTGQQAGSVDILHPNYQHVVGETAQELLRTDIDGLV